MLAEAQPGVTRKRLIVQYEEYWELNYTVLKVVWSILAIKVGLCSVKTASTICTEPYFTTPPPPPRRTHTHSQTRAHCLKPRPLPECTSTVLIHRYLAIA